MGAKYSSLEELRRKKEILKRDVAEMEDLLTFENTKESLSVLTKGFTDQYLTEEIKPDGESSVSLNTGRIVSEISSSLKEQVFSKNAFLGFAQSDAGKDVVQNAFKMGAVALVGNYARKNLYSTGWKKKLIGLALIYVAPIVLKFVRQKLEQYQKNRTTSSMEQLI